MADHSKLISFMIDKATNKVEFYKHDSIDLVHLFLSFNITLRNIADKGSPNYSEEFEEYNDKFTKCRTKYNIIGDALETSFKKYYPVGSNATQQCSQTPEFQILLKTLALIKSDKHELVINDLIIEIFRDKNCKLFDMFSDITGSREETDKFYDEVREIFLIIKALTYAEIDKIPYLTNLNTWVVKNPRTAIGVDDTINKIYIGLGGKSITSACLVGEAGCGKTELVYEFVQRINAKTCPEEFQNCVVYSLDLTGIVAGARYRGESEGRLLSILQFVKEHKDIILFIDEIHQMVGLGTSSHDEAGGGSDILKPYLSRGDIRVIGATTNDEFTKNIMRSKAFARRFFKVHVQEPDRAETKRILLGIIPSYNKHFNKTINVKVVDKILEYSNRYNLDQANPGKSIAILELTLTYSKLFKPENKAVEIEDVLKAMSLKYDINISDDRLKTTIEVLREKILGQDAVITDVIKTMNIVESGIVDEDRPLSVIMLAGPTGTGKTYIAELLAETYFGHKENLIKINASEFTSAYDVSKILGSAPGLIGSDDDTGILSQVKQRPASVILFDEIEKAHANLFKVIMNMLDKGTITDNKGDEVSFKNTVVIFTTNLGTDHSTGKEIGAGFMKSKEDTKSNLTEALKNTFRPEFLGRLDRIIKFDNLTNDIARELIDKYLIEYNAKLTKPVKFKEINYTNIIDTSDIIAEGARNIRKKVKEEMVNIIEKN